MEYPAQQDFSSQPAFPAPPGGEVYILPVSFAQQRLWFLSRLQPDSTAYNVFGGLVLRGTLDVAVLERSFHEIVRRHETLRTTFLLLDGEPVQVVSAEGGVRVTWSDLQDLEQAESEREVDRLLSIESQHAFDLTRGPLLRLTVLRLSPKEHVLIYVMHHIITDGWSERVFTRELCLLYQAFSADEPSPLPDLPIQYGDFAHWQRESLQGETLERLLSYWRQKLAGVSGVLDLPAANRRPPVFSHRGASERFAVTAQIAAALKELGSVEGATLFATLLAAFGVLLSRLSGDEDLLVGSPVANRNPVELEPLIGFFAGTLVLRLDLSGNPSFRELLRRVRDTAYEAQEHQDLPFEKLVNELGLERDPSRNPLVQVVFTMGNIPMEQADLGGLVLAPRRAQAETAKFDLTLGLTDTGNGLAGYIEYCTDLFDAAAIRRMLECFQVLLEAIAEGPERIILDLPLLTSRERQTLLFEWSGGSFSARPEACLHEIFEGQARRAPGATAVACGDESLSYGDLDRRAGILAAHLLGLLPRPLERVGICLDRSLATVVTILGILKAGAAYVPLDPTYPRERLDYLLRDSGVQALVTDRKILGELPELGGEVVTIDSIDWDSAKPSVLPPLPAGGAGPEERPAYVIYTSGSTGNPKGVVVTHGNVARLFLATQDWFGFDERDVWCLFHSYAFDFSVWEIWGALLHGGKLVVVPYWVSRSPESFHRLLREEGVTVLNQTPSAFYQLAREDASVEGAAPGLALRWVIFGGEALEPQKLGSWLARHGDRPRLVNMYGITETTVHVTYHEMTTADLEPVQGSPIGVPIPDLRLYILGNDGQPLPMGIPGEIYVGGAGVATGYLGRPDLTAQSFVPDPFSGQQGARLYRTGDRARHLSGGALEFWGRADAQVKIHGFRIEPGEIEAALRTHPDVAEAVVDLREIAGDKRLVAYIVPRPASSVHVEEARAFLQGKLPVHMVPSAFMLLSELPLTSHGKLNRKALPDPGSKRPLLQQQYVAPRGDIEAALASAWAEALGVDRVGVHDNFFTLGGDSMRSVHAVALARAQGLEVSLLQVFQLPTIAGLAREVRLKRDDSGEGASSEPFSLLSAEDRAVLPDDVVDAYPLTNLQAGMLYHREEMPDSPVFHNVNSWRLRLRFDPEAFQRAVLHVTERHPILRTSFDMTGYSEPLQLVHREARFPVGVEDLRHLGASEQERILAKYFERQLKSPFDLSQAPQLRLQFHRRTDDTVQLTLTENHAILDGWSLHVIFDEILRSYFSLLRNGVIAPLAPLRTTYRDFVRLERQALASAELREFWDRALADRTISQVSRWPGHRRDPGKRRIKRFVLPLSADLATELRRLADTESVPLKSVFLAAHFRVTGYLSGVPDVLTSISYHGRPETTDGQRLCGLFLNLHPLRLFMTGGTWRSLLRQIFQAETEVLPYRRYPLAAIQKKWGREPLMDTQFVYLSFHVLEDFAQSGEVEITGFGEFVEETNFAVVACFSQSVGRPAFSLTLDLDRNVFSDGQAEAIKDYYLRTLRAMTRDDGSGRYEDFCPLSEAERHALTIEWNDSARRYAWERPVHELFAEQAARRPDQPCVRCEEGCLTFRELDRRAEALAGRLRRCSVQPESRVALCAERGLDMVVGILGVLKAGGAYVPMDPYYPQERLDFMLQDAEVSVVLAPEQWIGRFAVSGAGLVRLDAITEHLSKDLDDLPAQGEPGRACSGNLAYVIYTSGSTGRPKGVAVEHRMLTNYLSSIREELKPPEGASYALVSTFAADLGNTMIFTSLCTGGCLHVLSDAQVRDPNAMADYFLREPIDGLKIVPSHLAAILEHPQPETLLPRKWLILGGEALDDVWARKVQLLAPECRIFNEYGPTETTVAVAAHELRDPEPGRGSATVPIGRPLGNSLLYVLDSYFEPLPVGAAGELYIGGVNVARGYLRRPDLTAGKFVPNPFGGEAGARLYRSGDRVRYLSSGALEFLGRIDQQAKIHGFRVEPGEVEALLNGHPAVRQAAALLRHDTGEPRLVAYVVCHREQETGEEELLSFLAEKVPPFMVPAAVVILAALPLTPNGKLDRQALPAPGQGRNGRAAGRRRTKPKNYFELQLLNIWQELLKVDIIGMEDDFFELGGDSLLALRLIAQIRKQFQAKIPLAALIKAKTIEQLARLLLEERGVSWDLVVPIQPRGSKPPFFCVAPGHGGVLCYLSIAQHMGIERPFYGLQWPDLEQTQDPYLSIEEIACRYIEALRHVRPQGPYLLGGWSFGGLVAFEMARQLTAEGERVEHLALLDTRTPEAEAELFEMEEPLMKAYLLVEHAKSMAGPSTDDELPLSPRDLLGLDLDQQLDFLIWTLQLQERLPSEFGPAMIRRYLEVRLARMVAIRNYVPKLYRGRITLYRCEDIYRKASLDEVRAVFERADQNRTYGWKRFTAEPVEVQDIPGNHETLVYEPSSRVLAQRLRDCLDRDQLIL